MKKKIIIVTQSEFTRKEFEKNSIKNFIDNNVKIEVWVINKIIKSNYKIDQKILLKHKNIKIKIIESLNKLNYYLNKEKNISRSCLFDMKINLSFRTLSFFKLFFLYNFDYIVFPGNELSKNNFHYSLYLKFINLFLLIYFLFSKVKINYAKYVYLISKKKDLSNNLLVSKKSKFILGHHADYDKYLEEKKKILTKHKFKYFVFLDQNVPHHTDLKRNSTADVNEKKYYTSLLNFFTKTENQFKYKYLIAPHPRADIRILKKYFGSRVSAYPAIKLVRNCEFVVSHDSDSTNFAFLFNKPIVPIINEQLINSKHSHKKELTSFCKIAKLKLFDISTDVIKKTDLTINKKNYSFFISHYINFKKSQYNRAKIIMNNIKFNK